MVSIIRHKEILNSLTEEAQPHKDAIYDKVANLIQIGNTVLQKKLGRKEYWSLLHRPAMVELRIMLKEYDWIVLYPNATTSDVFSDTGAILYTVKDPLDPRKKLNRTIPTNMLSCSDRDFAKIVRTFVKDYKSSQKQKEERRVVGAIADIESKIAKKQEELRGLQKFLAQSLKMKEKKEKINEISKKNI